MDPWIPASGGIDVNWTHQEFIRANNREEANTWEVIGDLHKPEIRDISNLCKTRLREIASVHDFSYGSNESLSIAEGILPSGLRMACFYFPKNSNRGTWFVLELDPKRNWREEVESFVRSEWVGHAKVEVPQVGAIPRTTFFRTVLKRNFREALILDSKWVPSFIDAGLPPSEADRNDSFVHRDFRAWLSIRDYPERAAKLPSLEEFNRNGPDEYERARQGISRADIPPPRDSAGKSVAPSPGSKWIIKKGKQVIVIRVTIPRNAPAELEHAVDKIALDVQRILQDVPAEKSPIKHNSSSDEHDRTQILGTQRG